MEGLLNELSHRELRLLGATSLRTFTGHDWFKEGWFEGGWLTFRRVGLRRVGLRTALFRMVLLLRESDSVGTSHPRFIFIRCLCTLSALFLNFLCTLSALFLNFFCRLLEVLISPNFCYFLPTIARITAIRCFNAEKRC